MILHSTPSVLRHILYRRRRSARAGFERFPGRARSLCTGRGHL